MSLPYDAEAIDFENVIMLLTPEQPILTYCSGLECDESFELSLSLIEQGFTNIVLFAGGFNAWDGAGHKVQGR